MWDLMWKKQTKQDGMLFLKPSFYYHHAQAVQNSTSYYSLAKRKHLKPQNFLTTLGDNCSLEIGRKIKRKRLLFSRLGNNYNWSEKKRLIMSATEVVSRWQLAWQVFRNSNLAVCAFFFIYLNCFWIRKTIFRQIGWLKMTPLPTPAVFCDNFLLEKNEH